MFNLHMHTTRCNHATGTDREYVEHAIKAGYTKIGFSDHAPILFPDGSNGHYIRMKPSEYEDYAKSVLSLKQEYKKDITIYFGLEAEYYPQLFKKNLEFWKQFPLDFLILGSHFIGNEYEEDSVYSGRSLGIASPSLLEKYVNQTIEGLNTGVFTCLAHPDLIRFTGSDKHYKQQMKRLCLCAKALKIPLEINLLGFSTNRQYPNPLFWKVAKSVGNDVIIGLDAHEAQAYDDIVEYIRCKNWAKSLGITVNEQMPKLINPNLK